MTCMFVDRTGHCFEVNTNGLPDTYVVPTRRAGQERNIPYKHIETHYPNGRVTHEYRELV